MIPARPRRLARVTMLVVLGLVAPPVVVARAADAAPAAPAAATAPAGAPASRGAPAEHDAVPETDCALGFAVWCVARVPRDEAAPPSRFRLEALGGYKLSNLYYRKEIDGCAAAGCTLRFDGPAFSLDAFYNVSGHPRGDDYFGLGLSTSYMPIVSGISNNTSGFNGELGRVRAGDGTLAYVPVRVAIRTPDFLLLIRSKYLVSSFGAGVAFPVTSGAGATFTGGDGPKITIGGRLGAELPLSYAVRVGVAMNWGVVWYGSTFGESSFQTSYGVNLAYLL